MKPRILHFTVSGQRRPCPDHWWEPLVGPKPEEDRGCDGCTSSPDFWMGFAIWPACLIHDFHYSADGPNIPRLVADLIFRINIWRVLRAQGCPRFRAAYVSMIYWSAVSAAGGPHFRRKPRLG